MRNGYRPRAGGFKGMTIKADEPPPPKVRPEYRTIGEYVQYYTRNHGERCEPVKWLLRMAMKYEDGLLTNIEQTPGQIHAFLQDLLLQRRRF